MAEKRKWFWQGWLDATDRQRDAKLLAFVSVTAAGIYWLTKEQARGPITQQWVDAFMWLLIAVSLGGGAWTAVDYWRNRNAAPKPEAQPGTKDQEGEQP